ncbi:proteasome subunit beta [Candidatus Bathyarchaeota archaeon ex4484_205]|nr:MAG: proteasome subunit beta [Candidatus Bathyarchaeota archaeon ex4484_205]RLG69141.1 MAG: proteasome subunit beta [archaeon]
MVTQVKVMIREMGERYYIPGATVIGARCPDGVILAADRRMSYGTFVMSKSAKKLYKVTERIGIGCAGLMGDLQNIVKEAKYHANMFRMDTGREISAHALAKLISNLLFANRMFPLLTQIVVGGFDVDKPAVYVLDPVGSVIEDKYSAVGTGAEVTLGVFESKYKENLDLNSLAEVVIDALKSAAERDSASGNGFDMIIINKKGIEEKFIPL